MPTRTNKDIRSVLTEQAIKSALLKLLEANNFESITINDICMEASISRTTFYHHFEDKFALVLRCIEDIVSVPEFDGDDSLEYVYDIILSANYENRVAIRSIMRYTDSWEIKQKADKLFYNIFYNFYAAKEAKGVKFEVPIELLALYNSSGSCGVIYWWIENDFKIEKELLVKYLAKKIRLSSVPFQV